MFTKLTKLKILSLNTNLLGLLTSWQTNENVCHFGKIKNDGVLINGINDEWINDGLIKD